MADTHSGGLSGAALKNIALVSMLLDHIGAVVLEYGLYYRGGADCVRAALNTPWGAFLPQLSLLLRMLGRPAFPIYCFLLTEGFLHTHDRRRYMLRLAVFALISEIPFNLAVENRLFYPAFQNVFFELLIGFFVLCGLEWAESRWREDTVYRGFFAVAFVGAGCGAAKLLKADYDVTGIFFISAFYCLRSSRLAKTLAAGALGFMETLGPTMGAGILSAVPIGLYNGKKGNSGNKYLFYWFYPVHLLVLFVVRSLWFGIQVS